MMTNPQQYASIARRLVGSRSTCVAVVCIALTCIAFTIGCADKPTDGNKPDATLPPLDVNALLMGNRALDCDDAANDAQVTAWLDQMTLAQKVAQMHGLQFSSIDGLYHAGGDDALGIPTLKMVDGPRGVRAGNATAFPVGMARGATWDPELERRVGLAIGLETAAKGGNVLLAPTINLLRHPGWGRAQETYSEDPFHMGQMALGFIGGAQNHVMTSAKHFAVNSVENTRFSMSANLDEQTLREVYLPHFRTAVEVAKVASVMSAYNRVNGTYCAQNSHLLSDILKGDWGFDGFVESDWILGVYSTVPSVMAGLDIEMPFGSYYGNRLIDAVESGDVDEQKIDDAVRRIVKRSLCFGLDAPAQVSAEVVESSEHRALALEVARASLVLLKNRDALLPLSAETLGRVAVVGALSSIANLGDHGSSSVTPSTTVSPLEGIRARIGEDRVDSFASDTLSDDDLTQIATADLAIVIAGLTYREEGEYVPISQEPDGLIPGGDRATLSLPQAQVEMIQRVAAHAQKTLVVLEGGSAILVRDWIDAVDGLVMAWYPGMAGGTAIAELIVGDVSPSGRLPVTFPRSEDQLPPWDITSDEVSYGFLHGYRLFDAEAHEPEYAFGFGLGYASVKLSSLRLDHTSATANDTVLLSVDVDNPSDREAVEVVQVYASAASSAVRRAPKVLVGFHRVLLAPHSAKTVQVAVPVASALSHWDTEAADWSLEATRYTFHVGTSSRDLPLTATLTVQ